MGLNGGGYTFIQTMDMARLTNDEVQTMFTDKSSFLMRIANPNRRRCSTVRHPPTAI